MPSKIERRVFPVQIRSAEDGEAEGRTITGYAALFNSMSENLGGFRERIAPGAFADCMENDVRCLFNHDPNFVLGRTASGTLKLSADERGLKFECSMPDTECADDVSTLMKRGDVDQCSFAFTVAKGGVEWADDEQGGTPTRTITRVKQLYDVSVVTYPAYPETTAQVRSVDDILSERTATRPAAADGGGDLDLRRRKLDLSLLIN